MLYDPKWTKPDALSLEGLISWLETKPADETYDYKNCRGECLFGQYMASHGISRDESCGPFRLHVYEHVAHQYPWTFGAALDRARQAPAAPHRS